MERRGRAALMLDLEHRSNEDEYKHRLTDGHMLAQCRVAIQLVKSGITFSDIR